MNKAILHKDSQEYIQKHLKSDINSLILKGSPFEEITIQELANQILAKKKAAKKLPTWFNISNIYYPPKLSIEQASSEITANYKANLIKGNSIIDVTGGFGVDTYFLAKNFKNVIHCEINKELSKIVAHNYQQLNINNIKTFAVNGLEYLKTTNQKFDCIYIDPSRRNDAKGKVFLLNDCLPNVPKNIDFLFTKTNTIILKNSPFLDLTATINELQYVKEIHVIAIKNEVKELLFLLEKKYENAVEIKTVNILNNVNQLFNYNYLSSAESTYSVPKKYLYEPNAAILKSGAFHQISQHLNVCKLHRHSHLYTTNNLIDFPGRVFMIEQVLPFDKKQLKKALPNLKANITTRNFPISVATIRKKTKVKDGGDAYLFFTTDLNDNLIIILTKKLN